MSNYNGNTWLLSSSNGRLTGAIKADANGTAQAGTTSTRQIALSSFSTPALRNTFVQNVNSMLASKQTINVTISDSTTYPGVLGTFTKYDPSSSVISYTVTKPGSGYTPDPT